MGKLKEKLAKLANSASNYKPSRFIHLHLDTHHQGGPVHDDAHNSHDAHDTIMNESSTSRHSLDDADIESMLTGVYSPMLNGSKYNYHTTTNQSPLDMQASVSTVDTFETSFSQGGYNDPSSAKRTRLIAWACLVAYLLLAVAVYSFWLEHWSIIDSLYFAVCTFTTIGFGDLYPSSDHSRLFTAFFAVCGIAILGFYISLLGQELVERYEEAMKSVEERASSRAKNMFLERDRNLYHRRQRKHSKRASKEHAASATRVIFNEILTQTPLIIGILAVAVLIGHSQGWSIASSLYFGIITSTTVGFGDLSITGEASRAVCVIALPLMVAVLCEVLSRIVGAYITYKTEEKEAKFMNRQLTPRDLVHMDINHDGTVEWPEFLVFMLQAMEKVEAKDIQHVKEIFRKLDTSGDGLLTLLDLQLDGES